MKEFLKVKFLVDRVARIFYQSAIAARLAEDSAHAVAALLEELWLAEVPPHVLI